MPLLRYLIPAALLLPTALAARSTWPPPYPHTPGVCTGVTMQLEPGVRGERGVGVPAFLPPMPLDPVVMQGPLYPESVPSSARPLAGALIGPGSPYLKTAEVEYQAPVAGSRVLSWYDRSFAHCGYREVDHGSFSQPGIAGNNVLFEAETSSNLYMSIAVRPASGGGAIVLYYATAYSAPARPPGWYVPSPEKRVRITYVFPDSTSAWVMTITNSAFLGALTGAIDALGRRVDLTLHSCPYYSGGGPYARLAFTSPSGRRTVVEVDRYCGDDFHIIGHRFSGMDDSDHTVWDTVSYAAHWYCWTHRCKKIRA